MLTDPLDGLSRDAREMLIQVKVEYEHALALDARASHYRQKMQELCIELRKKGVGVRRISRFLNVSDAYIYQITTPKKVAK